MRRFILIINGVQREGVCDPEKDSLADVVRRMGLTGTKVGCGTGQCGACTLILNGKVIRSCTKKMKTVPDHSRVETIEGLGTEERLHPLQRAFMTYASVQCGFCSPGFIMSAKGLLDTNPSPTRQQVRDWFTSHNNICRCTGYKPIVDAVMAAAAVLRGEKNMQDITFTPPSDGSVFGSAVPKPGALARVLGQCEYGADIAQKMPAGTYHLAVVQARTHHASIKGIHAEEAQSMPGVVKIITAKDVKGTNRLDAPFGPVRHYSDAKGRPVICDDTVYRYGDIVAVVAARTREEARNAAAKVVVDYEPLPAYMTYEQAVEPSAKPIHEHVSNVGVPNLFMEQPMYKGEDAKTVIDNAPFSVSGSFSTSREPHLVLEPECVQAYPEGDGGVAVQYKAQWPHSAIYFMANAIGLPQEKIHIIQNPVGGSFGYSMSPGAPALAAACALALNAPVSLVMSYEEHQSFTGKRSPAYTNARLACDENGKFLAMEYHVGVDHGAYDESAGALASKIARFFGYPYAIDNIRGLVQMAYTNNNFGVQYRGFGSPQTYMASEQLVDMLAKKIGMDPFEIRYRNIAHEGDLCTTSVPYREYPMQAMMDMMKPYYDEAVKNARQADTAEKKHGVGIAWGGYHVGKPSPEHSEIVLELNPDNTVTMFNCWMDIGQGADLAALVHLHECLRPLGLKPEQLHFVSGDTALAPDMGPSGGSRSFHVGGKATQDAARQLLDAMRKPDGTFRTYQEMKDENIPTRYLGKFEKISANIDPDSGHGYGAIEQNYMLFLAEVEVDVATGKTQVTQATVIADIGKIGSQHGALGQAWGGFSHALGFALSENYDDVKKHATMLGAGVPRCNNVPDNIRVIFHETPRPDAPFGGTGCSEGFQSAGHAAILNAIADAVDVRIYTLPATPEKVKAAMDARERGEELRQRPWNLGCELYDRLDYLKKHPYNKENNYQ
ncbi:molybdopterin-dependent aldehyde oxidoreductase [Mailhella sp.]|uniref:molybdopterin-dependent aldehyde oxidoreductase n=1 Tax=Mailhella sp. TaxID=1981029 RepID=UPI003AB75B45